MLKDWERSIEEKELMEKRRVAPGYLDTGLRILEPTKPASIPSNPVSTSGDGGGEELDRVFGKLGV